MSKYGVIQAYKDLPNWGKAVIAIGGLAITVALGLTIRNIIRKISAAERGKGALRDSGTFLRELSKKGVMPSYSDFQYNAWAEALHTAFSGYGTTTGQIGSIISQMKNDADLTKLVQAYGQKTISSGKWNPTGDFTGTLIGAMNDELTTMEIDQINYALQKKGISFRF